MFCRKCGIELKDGCKECPNCGMLVNIRCTEDHVPGYNKKNSRSLYSKWWFWAIMFLVLGLNIIVFKSYSILEDMGLEAEGQDLEIAQEVDETSNITSTPYESNSEIENFEEQNIESKIPDETPSITSVPSESNSEEENFEEQDTENEITEDIDNVPEEITDEGKDASVWSKEYLFWYLQGLNDAQVGSYIKLAKDFLNTAEQLDTNIYLKTDGGLFSKRNFEITNKETDLLYSGGLENNKPEGFGMLLKFYGNMESEEVNEYDEYKITPLFLPLYIGEFSGGMYNGKGILYVDHSQDFSFSDVGTDNIDDVLAYSNDYLQTISYNWRFFRW